MISFDDATASLAPAAVRIGPDLGRNLGAHAEADRADVPAAPSRTVWGLDPPQLHARYWAAHGVQVVRLGEPSEIVRHAELFLLTEPGALVLFPLAPLMDALNWIQPEVLFVRLHDPREHGYRENVVLDDASRFVRFQRLYDAPSRLTRVALTPHRDVAQLWQGARDPLAGWRRLRRFIRRHDRATRSARGILYDGAVDRDVAFFAQQLLHEWPRPDATVPRAHRIVDHVWRDESASVDPTAKFIGPVWVGAGRTVDAGATVIGPAIMWDDPAARPSSGAIEWLRIEPTQPPERVSARRPKALGRAFKRGFDILFSALMILTTLPLYPLIALAILLEDGGPVFFAHRRETIGGRDFPCVKFRSMRKDAERLKAELRARNQADGPQFYMEHDPRLTRTGRVLRRYHADELPQFFNVLVGHMSVVGPRPSPRSENQYCPAWREARLSVRPGITGLWQIKRTRRTGTDFQEWIQYDIEYVETRTLLLDLKIICRTAAAIFLKFGRS